MKLELTRTEGKLLVEGILSRIEIINNLIPILNNELLIESYNKDLNDLHELKSKIILCLNTEFYTNNI